MMAPTQKTTLRKRSCIVCGTKDDKRRLYRVVRTADGNVCFDGTGRLSGRGAYVCSPECFEKACKQGKIARGLKCKVEAPQYETIRNEFLLYLGENAE